MKDSRYTNGQIMPIVSQVESGEPAVYFNTMIMEGSEEIDDIKLISNQDLSGSPHQKYN